MLDIKRSLILAAWNLRAILKSPRAILCGVMAFLLCFLLSDHVSALSKTYKTSVQIMEPFIWCFSDSDSILFAALVMMLLLAALPNLSPEAAYLLFRTNRMTWLAGQVITMLAVTLLYVLTLLMSSLLLSLGAAYTANRWSETATLLSYMPSTNQEAIKVVRRVIKETTPYACAMDIFLLLEQYMLLLSLIQLAASIYKSKRAGVSAVLFINLAAYVLTPSRFMAWLQLDSRLRYIANLLSVWLSPLQHATYAMHTFGYDMLPALGVSHLLMLGVSLLLAGLSAGKFRRYQFSMTGGESFE